MRPGAPTIMTNIGAPYLRMCCHHSDPQATFPAALVDTDVQKNSSCIISEHEEPELMVTASVVAPDYR